MADYGIKVSVPGEDVKTASDRNLSLKSDLKLLKVHTSATGQSITSDKTVNHGLGYVPQFVAFVNDGTNTYFCTGHTSYGVARTDSSNLYIKDEAGGSDASSTSYYIFYEQA